MVGDVRYLGIAVQQEAWHCCSPQQQQQQRHLQMQHAGSEGLCCFKSTGRSTCQ
jgi:hypothetical protein